MSLLPENKIIYLLEQSKRKPLKVFKSLDQAYKTMKSKPSYHVFYKMLAQGGILYKVESGHPWSLVVEIPGQYHPVFDDLNQFEQDKIRQFHHFAISNIHDYNNGNLNPLQDSFEDMVSFYNNLIPSDHYEVYLSHDLKLKIREKQ